MTCSKCGNELNEGAKFCTKCGAKVRWKWLFISSIILISVGIIWALIRLYVIGFGDRSPFASLPFLIGITLALISLYKKKSKMTMIAVIAACALNLLIPLIKRIRMIRDWYLDELWISQLRMQNIRDVILSGAIILAFILLYKKKHKIILIAGLAVIALSFVLWLIYIFFRYVW